jgi:hypothetical protein
LTKLTPEVFLEIIPCGINSGNNNDANDVDGILAENSSQAVVGVFATPLRSFYEVPYPS